MKLLWLQIRSSFFYRLCLLACLILAYRSASAQVLYGNLVGNVTDASGAVVPDAAVDARNIATGVTLHTVSNGTGAYLLGNIPSGTFEVTITKDGFATFKATNVVIVLNGEVRVDAALSVGASSSTVTVAANAVTLQTESADVHTDIGSKQLQDLPQPTRTYEGLVGLATGVAPPSPDFAGGGGTNNPGRSFVIAANGTGDSATDVRIDGISAVNPWVQFYSTAVPSTEAIETVNVVTGSPEAEQGLAGGAQINVQLKSGTNQFHGEVYELHQDNALKARPYFQPVGTRLPKLIDNDFGGTIGGPIIKNKLFFFGSYEGDFLVQGNTSFQTVPTEAMKNGDFSGTSTIIYDPSTGNPDGTGKTPFANNNLSSRIDPIVAKLLPLIPNPNTTTFGVNNQNYFVSTPTSYHLHKIDTKYDWDVNSKLRIIGRYAQYPYSSTQEPVFGPQLGGGNTPDQHGDTYAVTVGATYLLSQNFLIDGSWGFTRAKQFLVPILDNVKAGSDQLGIPGTNLGELPAAGGLPQFNFSDAYSGYGYSYPYLAYNDPVYQYAANATWTHGHHNVKFGFDFSQQQMEHQETTPTAFTFSGGATTLNGGANPTQFNSFADFLLGQPYARTNSENPTPLRLYLWEYSYYARDQWQVTPKLTVTYGTGWEYFPVPNRGNRGIERFDFDTDTYLICGEGQVARDCGIHVQKTLFAPRIGLAYRPQNQMVLRGGFSLTPEQLDMFRDGLYNYPANVGYTDSSPSQYAAVAPLRDGIPVNPVPDISGGTLPLIPGISFATTPKNFTRGYIESYNATVEQGFGQNWLAQAAYVGTHTVHQHTRYNFNYGQVGGGTASQLLYKYGISASEVNVLPLESMNYNSMQLNLGHKFSQGYQINVGYTWSKWIAICCDTRGDGSPAIPIPEYFHLNRVVAPKDMRHIFNLSGIAELPFGKNKLYLQHGIGAAIAGGWQLNGILSIHSGSPFSVSADGTGLNAPGSQQRADQVKPSVKIIGGHGSTPYFDTTAFQPVPNTEARFGTANFNSLYGPGAANLDLSLFRSFPIHESWVLQVRADSLNLTNTPHFSNPSSNASSVEYGDNGEGGLNYADVVNLNGFGQITSTNPGSRLTDERYFRLGLKLTF